LPATPFATYQINFDDHSISIRQLITRRTFFENNAPLASVFFEINLRGFAHFNALTFDKDDLRRKISDVVSLLHRTLSGQDA